MELVFVLVNQLWSSCCCSCYLLFLLLLFLFTISTEAVITSSPDDSDDSDLLVITQEDLDKHKEEGGSYVAVHGRVYDANTLTQQTPCDGEKLAEWVGKDASKAFDDHHTKTTKEQLSQFCIGTYRKVNIGYMGMKYSTFYEDFTCRQSLE